MDFANAYNGICKLIFSEYFQITSAVLAIILSLFFQAGLEVTSFGYLFGAAPLVNAFIIIAVVLWSAILIISLVAAIMSMIGLSRSSKDEPKFLKTAFILSIILPIASFINSFLLFLFPFGYGVIQIIINIGNAAIFIFVVTGFGKLAKQLENGDVRTFGTVVLIIQILSLILGSVQSYSVGIALKYNAASLIKEAMILSVAASIFSLFAYIIYLVYLNKCRAMLEN